MLGFLILRDCTSLEVCGGSLKYASKVAYNSDFASPSISKFTFQIKESL